MKDYQTIREIAARTSLSEGTVRRIVREGVRHVWTGKTPGRGKLLVRWSDFDEWMARRFVEIKQDADVMAILEDMSAASPRTH